MRKIVHVASRELMATLATKGFIIGVLLTPLSLGVLVLLLPVLMDDKAPPVEGEIVVRDPTGAVYPGIRDYLRPEAFVERREKLLGRAREVMPLEAGESGMRRLIGEAPRLEVELVDSGDALEPMKARLRSDPRSLAIVQIDRDALENTGKSVDDGSYDLFVREKLDSRLEGEIHDAIRQAIGDARIRARGLDPDEIDVLTRVPYRRSTTITAEGEHETFESFNILLPLVFMGLVLMSVAVGGQFLVTTTIEEKQTRVVEVLLSAVTPMELMTGKILGQLLVGFLVLMLYSGMGLVALVSFALLGVLDYSLLVYLLVSYVIAFLVVGSLLAAVGAAVNELREAQTLIAPLMVVISSSWLLWFPVSRHPDSTLSVVTSFLPPWNTFVMLMRVTSTSPPAAWQVGLSLAIGIASVLGALWFASKVFRVGLLMHGKPPSLGTLVRWFRMA